LTSIKLLENPKKLMKQIIFSQAFVVEVIG
jgi:hypothetical protein